MTDLLLVQLAALAVHLDAVSQAIKAQVNGSVPTELVPPGSCPNCGASEESVEDASTFGHNASRCTKCGAEWDR
jgi:transposase